MPDFRYDQFCPLARAAEILAERWTLLVVRELLIGPQRFSDLRRRLPGLSSSVLSTRLRELEQRGLVARRDLPPPAASTVVELTELGEALRPVVVSMAAFGMRLMEARREGDHYEPSWLKLGLMVLCGPDPTPARCLELRMPDAGGEFVAHISGGPDGTFVHEDAPPADQIDAVIHADSELLLGIVTGGVDPEQARQSGSLRIDGDAAALADLPRLFSVAAAFAGRSTANAPGPPTQPSSLD